MAPTRTVKDNIPFDKKKTLIIKDFCRKINLDNVPHERPWHHGWKMGGLSVKFVSMCCAGMSLDSDPPGWRRKRIDECHGG